MLPEVPPPKSASRSQSSAKRFRIKINLLCTREVFHIGDLKSNVTVKELKDRIEVITGIPG